MANLQYSHPSPHIKCISICPYTNARAEIWKGYMVKTVGKDNKPINNPTFFHSKFKAIEYKDKLLKEI